MSEEPIATYTVLPATSAEVAASRETAENLIKVLESWAVETPEDEEKASAILASAHQRFKELDALRKKVAKPAFDAQKTINAHFKPALDAWKQAKTRVQRIMAEAVERREAANQARIALAAKGDAAALAQVESIEAPSGVSYREEVDIQIVDFDKIPRDCLTVDWSKLKIMVKNGEPAPPGVEFVRKKKVVPTGRA